MDAKDIKDTKRLIKDIATIRRSGKLPGHTGPHGAKPNKR
jgi:hypothetical protein